MIQMVVDEIRRLAEEEGLRDGEIAERLGVSRATVNRARQKNGVDRANLAERKDKTYTCKREGCGKVVTIARKQRKEKYCPECKAVVLAEQAAARKAKYEAQKQAKAA